MSSTRRRFLIRVVALASAPVAAANGLGCGDDDAPGGGGGSGGGTGGGSGSGGGSGGGAGGGTGGGGPIGPDPDAGLVCVRVDHDLISVPGFTHNHSFDLRDEDVVDGIAGTYHLTSGHNHDVVLTAEDLEALAAGETIVVMSGNGGTNPHTHGVQISCELG